MNKDLLEYFYQKSGRRMEEENEGKPGTENQQSVNDNAQNVQPANQESNFVSETKPTEAVNIPLEKKKDEMVIQDEDEQHSNCFSPDKASIYYSSPLQNSAKSANIDIIDESDCEEIYVERKSSGKNSNEKTNARIIIEENKAEKEPTSEDLIFSDPVNTFQSQKKDQLLYLDAYENWFNSQEAIIEVNCVHVFNLDARVDEEILYELFCKVGKIKRMKLFRIVQKDINYSQYLRSLDLGAVNSRPHKKKALIEYHAPNYAANAIQVFHTLKLYGRPIFLFKDNSAETCFKITFTRSMEVNPWFDAFFCIDYFSNITNVVRVLPRIVRKNTALEINVFFYKQFEFNIALDALEKDLKRYLDPSVKIYAPRSTIQETETGIRKIKMNPNNKNNNNKNFNNKNNNKQSQNQMRRPFETISLD